MLDQLGLNGYRWFIVFLKQGDAVIINVSEAKTKLSKLIDMAYHGEEVIIAKNNLPLVELVAYKPKAKRKMSLLKGQVNIPDDFMDENDTINAMFYGGNS